MTLVLLLFFRVGVQVARVADWCAGCSDSNIQVNNRRGIEIFEEDRVCLGSKDMYSSNKIGRSEANCSRLSDQIHQHSRNEVDSESEGLGKPIMWIEKYWRANGQLKIEADRSPQKMICLLSVYLRSLLLRTSHFASYLEQIYSLHTLSNLYLTSIRNQNQARLKNQTKDSTRKSSTIQANPNPNPNPNPIVVSSRNRL